MPERTVSEWQQDDDVRAHVLVDGDRPLAYGELWFDTEENEAELARLIVDPGMRGQGLGRELVRGLLARAVKAGFDNVFLRVHPDNGRALGATRARDSRSSIPASRRTGMPPSRSATPG
ncbi:GNAT family N-acetyltransferase [Streptomyces sp. NPDC004579]|uniref:GNAT family N-acetyltransferase n=1 Tax=Streptomyces sp. NPDC004579 TaxID=3154667 RepID=UPI0033B09820